MEVYLISFLVAVAIGCAVAIPFLLRSRAPVDTLRDAAWRDELPLFVRMFRPLMRAYAASVEEGMDPQRRDVLQSQLDNAGASYLMTPAEFIVIKRGALLVGLVFATFMIFALDVDNPAYVAGLLGLIPLGFTYPDIWLRDAMKARHAKFEKGFPFFLDVLVLGMKAGLTFPAAVEQAVRQMNEGPVKQEFSRYLRETRTGITRRVALDRLAARVLMPSVTNFVASVSQAEETGGSLGEVLGDQARQRRTERFLRAEKLANQAPVKMLFPLIGLLFPITFIIITFPIALKLYDSGIFN
ncbi:MAG TPA: type II secretion system F family protein [Steroidobacter sp.]|uniref:type II secretion system F family protein n=1 Tax=Steroidobacter sp. TaxID=1978227 RepID=UPI002ED7BA2D